MFSHIHNNFLTSDKKLPLPWNYLINCPSKNSSKIVLKPFLLSEGVNLWLLNSLFDVTEKVVYATHYSWCLVFIQKQRNGIYPSSNVGQVMETDTKVIIIKINMCNKDSDSIFDIWSLTTFKLTTLLFMSCIWTGRNESANISSFLWYRCVCDQVKNIYITSLGGKDHTVPVDATSLLL